MNASQKIPSSTFERAHTTRWVLWKWSFFITAIVIAFLMWQCGSALLQGPRSANQAVRHFRQELNGGEYEQIWEEASDGFRQATKHDEQVGLLRGVHTKLGAVGTENLINLTVSASMGGTFVTTRYNTNFAIGPSVETFTWIRSGTTLKLYAYNVQSNALFN